VQNVLLALGDYIEVDDSSVSMIYAQISRIHIDQTGTVMLHVIPLA
jgi:hypothetical protein